jgi:hypothetical protein
VTGIQGEVNFPALALRRQRVDIGDLDDIVDIGGELGRWYQAGVVQRSDPADRPSPDQRRHGVVKPGDGRRRLCAGLVRAVEVECPMLAVEAISVRGGRGVAQQIGGDESRDEVALGVAHHQRGCRRRVGGIVEGGERGGERLDVRGGHEAGGVGGGIGHRETHGVSLARDGERRRDRCDREISPETDPRGPVENLRPLHAAGRVEVELCLDRVRGSLGEALERGVAELVMAQINISVAFHRLVLRRAVVSSGRRIRRPVPRR